MSDITELILTEYYGFGVDKTNKKCISSYEATYDPSRFYQSSDMTDLSDIEPLAETSGRGTSSEAVKDDAEDSNLGDCVGNRIVRSSRAILDDDDLEDEDSETNELEALLETSPPQKERPPGEEIKIPDVEDPSTPTHLERAEEFEEVGRSYSNLGHFDDTLPDNASDASSVQAKKTSKKKEKSPLTAARTAFTQPPPPPRKLPACNGVFLDLTNLRLTEFPNNMLGNIPNLRMLYLENNSLTRLPEELFTGLRLLQWLDVRNNKLTTLPDSMKYHPSLETILLEGNLFEKLPMELCLLPSLKALQTSGNPLTFPPADVVALGFAATISFLRTEWNKSHPDEIVVSPEKDKKPRPSTILCSDPPVLRPSSKSSRLLGSSSTGRVSERASRISVRQRSRNYRPSNRYNVIGGDKINLVEPDGENHRDDEQPTVCDSCLKNSIKNLESTDADDLDAIVKPAKGRERVFDIITNDRTVEKLCPMRIKDPDRMLEFLENYLGIKKRCENRGANEELEARLLWIAKVKEMLTKQAIALQKIKDRDALRDWRRDRRSYEKSMSRAANRTEEDIPFGMDAEEIPAMLKNRLKIPAGAKSRQRGSAPPRDINEKMTELYESLNRLQEARKSESLSPRSEQKILEKEIRKLTELQDEIRNLKRHNEISTAVFEGSKFLPETRPYKPPPSIII